MAKLIDPNELIDPGEAADILGFASSNVVSVYRRRYADFPAPVVEKGRCVLWRRQDIEAWVRSRRR